VTKAQDGQETKHASPGLSQQTMVSGDGDLAVRRPFTTRVNL